MTARRLLLASGSALLMAPLFQGSAVAAPEKEVISLTCGTTTHQIVVNGNGDFTPGRDFTSTWVFIPHAFGPFTGVIRNAAGEVQETFTEPAFVQGSGKQPQLPLPNLILPPLPSPPQVPIPVADAHPNWPHAGKLGVWAKLAAALS